MSTKWRSPKTMPPPGCVLLVAALLAIGKDGK